jgi:hypothetical protein
MLEMYEPAKTSFVDLDQHLHYKDERGTWRAWNLQANSECISDVNYIAFRGLNFSYGNGALTVRLTHKKSKRELFGELVCRCECGLDAWKRVQQQLTLYLRRGAQDAYISKDMHLHEYYMIDPIEDEDADACFAGGEFEIVSEFLTNRQIAAFETSKAKFSREFAECLEILNNS